MPTIDAIKEIARERARQRRREGWTSAHDDEHTDEELAKAAACYAMPRKYPRTEAPRGWPWCPSWWKPYGRRRDLIRAGALIVAEIERLDRADRRKG